jgi:hypothetical protein
MPIILKESGGGNSVPVGTHLAVCYRIVDMGVQPDTGFGEKHKLSISWEVPGETIVVDGKTLPMSISKTYTLSLNKKSVLRQDLSAWRGRDFTAEELAGFKLASILCKGCLITVETNEAGKARVSKVTSVMKGMTVPFPVNPPVEYSVEDGKNQTYRELPEWLKRACDQAIVHNAAPPAPPAAAGEPSDVPF